MVDVIVSLQNARVKLTNQLQNRARTRRKERKIVLEGSRLLGDALQQGHEPLFVFYDPAQASYELIALLQNTRAELLPASDEVIRYISDTENPQGIVGVFPLPLPKIPHQVSRLLILDQIRDPGNLGTILRTAGASGVQAVILSPGSVDPYNPKVLRAGMGAHFRVPIVEAQWPEIAAYTEDCAIYFATGDGETVYSDVDWTQRWALVIGNEAHGISASEEHLEGTRIAIPMDSADSLNAAIASSVILFEAQRQRRR